MPEQIGTARRPTQSFLIAALTATLLLSVVVNFLLARRVQLLRATRVLDRGWQVMPIGSTAPSIWLEQLDGSRLLLSYDPSKSPTVLYFFTPQCSWCARNLGNFKALLNGAKGKYRVLGVSLSDQDLKEYVKTTQMDLPVYSGVRYEFRKTYRVVTTPETLVVSPDGHVLKNWMGAWVGKNQEEIEAYFHVKLPGLTDLPKPEDARSSLSSQAPLPAK